MPHKSPGTKALVSCGLYTKRRMSLNLVMDDMFRDDVSMDSFIETIAGQTEPDLDAHDGQTDAFFN